MAEAIWQKWGKLHIDLFATRDNNKILMFVSPFPNERAWAVDTLAITWSGMWAYAFPLFLLILLVLQKIREEQVELVLVAP